MEKSSPAPKELLINRTNRKFTVPIDGIAIDEETYVNFKKSKLAETVEKAIKIINDHSDKNFKNFDKAFGAGILAGGLLRTKEIEKLKAQEASSKKQLIEDTPQEQLEEIIKEIPINQGKAHEKKRKVAIDPDLPTVKGKEAVTKKKTKVKVESDLPTIKGKEAATKKKKDTSTITLDLPGLEEIEIPTVRTPDKKLKLNIGAVKNTSETVKEIINEYADGFDEMSIASDDSAFFPRTSDKQPKRLASNIKRDPRQDESLRRISGLSRSSKFASFKVNRNKKSSKKK